MTTEKGIRKGEIPYEPIGEPNDSSSLYNYLMRFVQYIKMRNYSLRTLENRFITVRRFILWCHERNLVHPADITKPILERYQRHLFLMRSRFGKPLSPSTQNSHITGIRAYFRWLSRNNYILSNPASDLEMARVTTRLPQNILSASEVESVLNQADTSTPSGIRDRAMMEVLYSTGIRRIELVQINLEHINMDEHTLMVAHGKGDKDRMLPVGQRAINWVEKYLNHAREKLLISRKELDMSEQALFLGNHGQGITACWLSTLVTRYISKADIGKTGSCHMFRHSMATGMLENGADIRYIQMM